MMYLFSVSMDLVYLLRIYHITEGCSVPGPNSTPGEAVNSQLGMRGTPQGVKVGNTRRPS
jgi:hypothetical protein